MKIQIDKQVIEQALEALNRYREHYECEDTFYSCPAHESAWEERKGECCCGSDSANEAITAIRSALAESVEQVVLPSTAYVRYHPSKYNIRMLLESNNNAPAVPDTNAALIIEHHETTIARMAEALTAICVKCRSNEWGLDTPRKEILNWMHDTAAEVLK